MTIVRNLFDTKSKTCNKRKLDSYYESAKKISKSKHSLEQCDSNSSDESDEKCDINDSFTKLFHKNKNEPLYISQNFQFQIHNERRKIIIPGETGTHLIKIEISEVKGLKKCKSERFFWQKVSKRIISF